MNRQLLTSLIFRGRQALLCLSGNSEKRKWMGGSKLMLGGGITAIIAAVAMGFMVYGNRDPQTVPITKASDPGGRPLAALGTQRSLRELGVVPERIAKKAFQERNVTLDTGDTLMGILLTAGVPRREAYAASTAMEKVYDPRDLRAGQKIKLFIRDTDDLETKRCFEGLEFVPETDRLISVVHDTHDSFSARIDAAICATCSSECVRLFKA